jgi:hypothetical protein
MGKLVIGALAFVAGAITGALAVKAYVEKNALSLVAKGAAEKIFGEGSKAASFVGDLASAGEGLLH